MSGRNRCPEGGALNRFGCPPVSHASEGTDCCSVAEYNGVYPLFQRG